LLEQYQGCTELHEAEEVRGVVLPANQQATFSLQPRKESLDDGFTEDDIWDIAGISAFFGMSNRLANVTSMRPNRVLFTGPLRR
jgi:alkylhydroperoxidase family enzyme